MLWSLCLYLSVSPATPAKPKVVTMTEIPKLMIQGSL